MTRGVFRIEEGIEFMNILLDTLREEKRVELSHENFFFFFEQKVNIPPKCTLPLMFFVHGWCKANQIDVAN